MKRDFLTFLLFLGLAVALWLGHALQSVRNTRVPVLVSYTGLPGTIGLEDQGLPDTVMIEVRDAGKRLNQYMHEPLRLTIDLRSYIHGEKGTIHIPSDALRRSISNLLQGTSSLIEAHPDELVCGYFTEQEKTVAIVWAGKAEPAEEYQLVGQPSLSLSQIHLYGKAAMLDKIQAIETEAAELTRLTDTTATRVALRLPAGIRAEKDSVTVTVIAERYTEKKMIVPLHVTGVPEGYHIRLFPREVEVSVRTGLHHFEKVEPADVRAVCVYTPERADKLDVELHYTKPYITSAWAYPATVEFVLEQ